MKNNLPQQSIETVIGYVQNLVDHGKSTDEAIDHAALHYGIERSKMVRVIADYKAGHYLGHSGETVFGATDYSATS